MDTMEYVCFSWLRRARLNQRNSDSSSRVFPVWRSMKRWSRGGVARCACRRRSRCCFQAVAPSLPCALQCWSKHQLLLFLGGRRQRRSVASPRLFQDNLRSGLERWGRWGEWNRHFKCSGLLRPGTALRVKSVKMCVVFPRTWLWYAQHARFRSLDLCAFGCGSEPSLLPWWNPEALG